MGITIINQSVAVNNGDSSLPPKGAKEEQPLRKVTMAPTVSSGTSIVQHSTSATLGEHHRVLEDFSMRVNPVGLSLIDVDGQQTLEADIFLKSKDQFKQHWIRLTGTDMRFYKSRDFKTCALLQCLVGTFVHEMPAEPHQGGGD